MSLFEEKKADGFKTESPIRAFADFQVAGTVAIGKGFRPSLAHLAKYLGAMEEKEGWRVVQVMLSNAGGDPTIIFHRDSEHAVMPEMQPVTIRGKCDAEMMHDYLKGLGWSLVVDTDKLIIYKATVPDLPFNPRAVQFEVREIKNPEEPDYTGRRYWRDRLGSEDDALSLTQPRIRERPRTILQRDLGAPHEVPLLLSLRSNFGRYHESSGLFENGEWRLITSMEPLVHIPLGGEPSAWRERPQDKWQTGMIEAEPDLGAPHDVDLHTKAADGSRRMAYYSDGRWWDFWGPPNSDRNVRTPIAVPAAWRRKRGDKWSDAGASSGSVHPVAIGVVGDEKRTAILAEATGLEPILPSLTGHNDEIHPENIEAVFDPSLTRDTEEALGLHKGDDDGITTGLAI